MRLVTVLDPTSEKSLRKSGECVSNDEPSRDRLDAEKIPPRNHVKDQMARLQWIVWEAIGLTLVMDSRQRYLLAEICAAHLYAGGAEVQLRSQGSPNIPEIPFRPPLDHHRRITDLPSGYRKESA